MTQQTTKITKSSIPNREKVINTVSTFPGLRFFELKRQTDLPNGTLQHHVNSLVKTKQIRAHYDNAVPRYFSPTIDKTSQILIKRLTQQTTSKIIKLLLKHKCQTFNQLVKYSKKSPGTVSVYKNMLLDDKIIIGDTTCKCSNGKDSKSRITYRLADPESVKTLVMEYGKNKLRKSSDNLADIFLSIK